METEMQQNFQKICGALEDMKIVIEERRENAYKAVKKLEVQLEAATKTLDKMEKTTENIDLADYYMEQINDIE